MVGRRPNAGFKDGMNQMNSWFLGKLVLVIHYLLKNRYDAWAAFARRTAKPKPMIPKSAPKAIRPTTRIPRYSAPDMKTALLFSFPKQPASRMEATVDGMTAIIIRAISGIASVNVGKKFSMRYGVSNIKAMEMVAVRISATVFICRRLFPLDSSASKYC